MGTAGGAPPGVAAWRCGSCHSHKGASDPPLLAKCPLRVRPRNGGLVLRARRPYPPIPRKFLTNATTFCGYNGITTPQTRRVIQKMMRMAFLSRLKDPPKMETRCPAFSNTPVECPSAMPPTSLFGPKISFPTHPALPRGRGSEAPLYSVPIEQFAKLVPTVASRSAGETKGYRCLFFLSANIAGRILIPSCWPLTCFSREIRNSYF